MAHRNKAVGTRKIALCVKEWGCLLKKGLKLRYDVVRNRERRRIKTLSGTIGRC